MLLRLRRSFALLFVAGLALLGCAGKPAPAGLASDCDPSVVAPAVLQVGVKTFPTAVLAENVLRSHVSTQGLEYPAEYGPRLAAALERHRVGEVLMLPGFVLRDVTREPSGDYQAQVATRMAEVDKQIAPVLAAGGTVHLKFHCATPRWLTTHDFPHSVLTGLDAPNGEPTWACAASKDLAEWRKIMRGVGAHFAARQSQVLFSMGSEPENYFAGTRDELFDWYAASVNGLRDAGDFHVGGLTFVGHQIRALDKTAPTLQQNKLTFTRAEYPESLTRSWIERSAALRLPLHLVTLHQFGGSPVPEAGTPWRRTRADVSSWLTQNGYAAAQVEVLVEDWPQWAPYESNDTEYFASHVAGGVLSMLDLSLKGGAPIRPVQGFLFDFGFRPEGDHLAGYSGRAGWFNENGLIKPVFTVNSLFAEVKGTLTPVDSSSPFVHAVAGVGPSHTTVLVTNQVPLEYQVDLLSRFWEQRPILETNIVEADLSGLTYDPVELVAVFYGGKQPSWSVLLEDFLKEPSRIDLAQLSWPTEIKAQWEERRRYGRLARQRRTCATAANLETAGLADGTYRLEHYVVDSQRANPFNDRWALDERVKKARRGGADALAREAAAINQAYGLEAGKQPDVEVVLSTPRQPLTVTLQPNSVHLLRLTRK